MITSMDTKLTPSSPPSTSCFNTKDIYVVKKVLSGSSFIIRGKPVMGPPPQLTVQLLFLKPSGSLKKFSSSEWKQREFLRELIVGKCVKLTFIRGNMASVLIQSPQGTPVDLALMLLEKGLASIKLPPAAILKDLPLEISQSLLDRYQNAEVLDIGQVLIKEEDVAVNFENNFDDKKDLQTLFTALHGKKISGVVEQVLDATTFAICHQDRLLHVSLAGLKSPYTKESINFKGGEEIKSVALEGQFFVETKLLQKSITLKVVGLSSPCLVCTLESEHVRGFEKTLVKEGFVSTVQWGLDLLKGTPLGTDYLAAEKDAKARQIRLWKNTTSLVPNGISNLTASKSSTVPSDSVDSANKREEMVKAPKSIVLEKIEGKIVKILSGDSLSFLSLNASEPVKVFLSGIRQPPTLAAPSSSNAAVHVQTEVGFRHVAKEALRAKAIGKKATLVVHSQPSSKPAAPEGQLPASEPGAVERIHGFVILGNHENLSESLLRQGLGTFMLTPGLAKGSSEVTALINMEHEAREKMHGLHAINATNDVPMIRVIDVQDKERAESLYPSLQRQDYIKAIVEHVFQGHRYKLFLPSLSYRITFSLANVLGPMPGDSPLAQSVKGSVEDCLLQRTVYIKVGSGGQGPDKFGIFYGSLKKANSDSMNTFLASLLAKGFLRLKTPDSMLSPFEEEAKANRLGIWTDDTLFAQKDPEPVLAKSEAPWTLRQFAVCNVDSLDAFHIHWSSSSSLTKFTRLMALLQQVCPKLATVSALPPPSSTFIYKSTVDKLFYRAQLLSKDKVLFIDYGTTETLTGSCIIPVATVSKQSELVGLLAEVPPQAILATLETPLIRLFPDYADTREALDWFCKAVDTQPLSCLTNGTLNEFGAVSLIIPHLTASLLSGGFAFIPRKFITLVQSQYLLQDPVFSSIISASQWLDWLTAQTSAKKSRRNGWHYGTLDLDPDELHDDPNIPRKTWKK